MSFKEGTDAVKNYLWVFLISMVPIVELRGAIPVGATLGNEWLLNMIAAVAGNLLPVPFILLFIRHVVEWMKKTRFHRVAEWIEAKSSKHSAKVMKYATFGLFLFVAIPLPGTGAWTGALVASMLDMRMKYAIPSIAAGVVAAAVIMSLASYGFVSFLSFLA